MDVFQVVGALKFLEGKYGSPPSTKEIAAQAGCAEATAIKYLQVAVSRGLIVQRGYKQKTYMSLEVARAFDAQKK
jgi:DNA-binding IclR family transcriptional regulator